jgi:hypothetical protein
MAVDTTLILNELSKELEPLIKAILEQHGVKQNSDLINSITPEVQDDKTLNFLMNDYYQYVSTGRVAGARKIPIEYLIEFIKKNNIFPKPKQTINQLAFAIMTSIYEMGIRGKNYVDTVMQTLAEYSQKSVADDYTEQVADEITIELTPNE